MDKLRITGGSLKGRNISIPRSGEARYTSSKVREAIFNIIGDVSGCVILDLFAGSGAFAIEAVSRGARSATCVEKSKEMADNLKRNVSIFALDKDCLVLNMDVRYAIPYLHKKGHAFDIIFMDPPYERDLIMETISLLRTNLIYDESTWFILEYSKRETIGQAALRGWREEVFRRYGDTAISILRAEA